MHSGGSRWGRVLGAAGVAALVLSGAACGGGDGTEEAAPSEVQLLDPGEARDPQPTASTTSTTTTTEAPTTTTTEAPTTTTTEVEDEPEEGDVPADIVDQANYICGSRQYDNLAGGDQLDVVAALQPVTEQIVAELRPLAEAQGGRFLEAVQNLDLAIALSAQPDERDQVYEAYDAAADDFATVGIDQCAARL